MRELERPRAPGHDCHCPAAPCVVVEIAAAHGLYLAAPADMRRMLNQAVFSELRVRDTTIVRATYTDGFAALHDEGLTEMLEGEERRREARYDLELGQPEGSLGWSNQALQQGQGSNYPTLVGNEGLEPPTSAM
jgi:hypothetical protein